MTSESSSSLKTQLRAEALSRRDALDRDFRAAASSRIAENVLDLISALGTSQINHGPVAGFWPIRSEVDPRTVLKQLAAQDFSLALPCVTQSGLVFRTYKYGDVLERAGFGLSHPSETAPIVRPTLLLVPLAAFDRRGQRIGYGAGYYDRAIDELQSSGPITTIGVAFAVQEITNVPHEDHDRPLDWIVTEREVVGPLSV